MDPRAHDEARSLIESLGTLVTCETGAALDFRHADGSRELGRPGHWYDPESRCFYCDPCRAEIDDARSEAHQLPLAWVAVIAPEPA